MYIVLRTSIQYTTVLRTSIQYTTAVLSGSLYGRCGAIILYYILHTIHSIQYGSMYASAPSPLV